MKQSVVVNTMMKEKNRNIRGAKLGRAGGRSQSKDMEGDETMGEDPLKWKKNKEAFSATSDSCWISANYVGNKPFDPEELKNFIASKSSMINIIQWIPSKGKLFLQLETPAQATSLQRTKTIHFQGSKVYLNYSAEPKMDNQKSKTNLYSQFVSFAEQNYNRDAKLLNIVGLGGHQLGDFPFDFAKIGPVRTLFRAIGETCKGVTLHSRIHIPD